MLREELVSLVAELLPLSLLREGVTELLRVGVVVVPLLLREGVVVVAVLLPLLLRDGVTVLLFREGVTVVVLRDGVVVVVVLLPPLLREGVTVLLLREGVVVLLLLLREGVTVLLLRDGVVVVVGVVMGVVTFLEELLLRLLEGGLVLLSLPMCELLVFGITVGRSIPGVQRLEGMGTEVPGVRM